jgi:hypothetical protein
MERKFKEGDKVLPINEGPRVYTVVGYNPQGNVVIVEAEGGLLTYREDKLQLCVKQPMLQTIYPHINDIVKVNAVRQVFEYQFTYDSKVEIFRADSRDVGNCYDKAVIQHQWPKAQWPPRIGEIIYDMECNAFVSVQELYLENDGTVKLVSGSGFSYYKDTCGTEWQWVYRRE